MYNKVLIIVLAGLFVTMFSCKRQTARHVLVGVWEGTVLSQTSESYPSAASLEFISIDTVKQEAIAYLLYPVETAKTIPLSGTIKGLKIELQNNNYKMYGALSADTLFFSGNLIRIIEKDTLSVTFRNSKFYYSGIENDDETDDAPQIPQIISINKSPDKLTKEVATFTVTVITEGKKVTPGNTEFSLDGKDWQKSAEFKNVKCGKYIFHTRNRQNKSLQDQKEMFFECFADVDLPTIPQLCALLEQIAACDDAACDELRKFGRNLSVRGVENINNIEQLIRDACMNGKIYVVERIETDQIENLAAIIIFTK